MTFDSVNNETVNSGTSSEDTTDHGQDKNHNFLLSCSSLIRERYDAAKQSSKATLEDMRAVGEALNEAKDGLAGTGKGAFGKWCDAERFPFDASWRARLMKLAANWKEIMAAVEALPEDKRKWSVDAVMSIWAAAKKEATAAAAGSAGGDGEGEGGDAPKEKKETAAEKLKRELAEALAEIERLTAENEKLRNPKGDSFKSKAKDAEPPKDAPGFISAALKAKAAKCWALYQRGGTEGEKNAAHNRLTELGSKVGLDFDAFCKACGLAV